MTKVDAIEELYVEQLRELYSAETQYLAAFPDLFRIVHDRKLKADFERHLEQTRVHLQRIERLLKGLDQSPNGHKCDALVGFVKEGKNLILSEKSEPTRDAALVEIAQRIERYEIASYGCVRIYASLMGDDKAAEMLQTTLNDEADMNRRLTSVSNNSKIDYRSGNLSRR